MHFQPVNPHSATTSFATLVRLIYEPKYKAEWQSMGGGNMATWDFFDLAAWKIGILGYCTFWVFWCSFCSISQQSFFHNNQSRWAYLLYNFWMLQPTNFWIRRFTKWYDCILYTVYRKVPFKVPLAHWWAYFIFLIQTMEWLGSFLRRKTLELCSFQGCLDLCACCLRAVQMQLGWKVILQVGG